MHHSGIKEFIKQKKNAVVTNNTNNTQEDEVEFLYISPTAPATTFHTKIKSDQFVTIICEDNNNNNHNFLIPYETARKSKFLAHILSNDQKNGVKYKENQEHGIRLPQFKSDVLEEIFRFCALDSLANPNDYSENDNTDSDTYTSSNKARVSFMFTLNPSLVVDLIIAAHFLVIPPLVSIAIKYIAEYVDVDDVSVLGALPPDVLQNIYTNFTPHQLAHIETTQAHKQLEINTSSAWKLLCEKCGWFIMNNSNTDWKTIYFEQQLRCMLIDWNDSKVTALFDLINIGKPFIHKVYINRTEPSWQLYLSLLTHLHDFEIYENNLKENNELNKLVDIISSFPLTSLTLCDCHLDDECIDIIAPLLTSPKSLITRLDLSQNFISQEGASKLAEKLKAERSPSASPLTIILSFNNCARAVAKEEGKPSVIADVDFGPNIQCLVSFDRTFLQQTLPHRY